jgi:YjbE family integral membrane protein
LTFDASFLGSLVQVLLIDLVLAGDNAVVIGLAAAGLPRELRRKAIVVGIIAATALRIIFALITTQLLLLGGTLLIVGGLLLLYVCWKMYRELHQDGAEPELDQLGAPAAAKTLPQAVMQIVIADVSMSLDNVLAVAGAAGHHLEALVFGLTLSVILMGVAASLIAVVLSRHRWITWLGLVVITYVALRMLYGGLDQVLAGALPTFH